MTRTEFMKRFGLKPIGNNRQAWDFLLPDGERVLMLWHSEHEGDGVYKALQRNPSRRYRGTGPINRLTSLQRFAAGFPLLAAIADSVDPNADPKSVKRVRSQCLVAVKDVWRDEDSWRVRIERPYVKGVPA